MNPFSSPWKHYKTVRFSDIFQGLRKSTYGTNKLIIPKFFNSSLLRICSKNTLKKRHNSFNVSRLWKISRWMFNIRFSNLLKIINTITVADTSTLLTFANVFATLTILISPIPCDLPTGNWDKVVTLVVFRPAKD